MGAPDPLTDKEHNLILFDGVCNLCNGAVQFIITRDKKEKFRFASLQSSLGRKFIDQSRVSTETIMLIKNNKIYDRSSAALEIAKDLSGAWPALYIFKIVPKFLRDGIYNLIAKNRYRWFGKKDECMIPSPEIKSKFLEL
jgi:predicted DCC family thiol-disulfide oxidoreductase YuxK